MPIGEYMSEQGFPWEPRLCGPLRLCVHVYVLQACRFPCVHMRRMMPVGTGVCFYVYVCAHTSACACMCFFVHIQGHEVLYVCILK